MQFKFSRTLITAITCCFVSLAAQAQIGVAFYQSDIQFIGISYEIKDRFRPEVSFGVDQNFENIPLMLDVNYDILQKKHYEVYAGTGVLLSLFDESEPALTLPIGVNIYPFEKERLGLHIEALPVFINENPLLLGSWGIRYQFGKDE